MPELSDKNTNPVAQPPLSDNIVDYSCLKEIYSPIPFKNFSIKYVVDGTETYSVNGNKYHIKNNEYLLANKFSEGFVEINSKSLVKGICIDVTHEILSEVTSHHLIPSESETDLTLDIFFHSNNFLENKYKAQQTQLGTFLREVEGLIQLNPNQALNFNKEFYYTVAEKIVADHIPVFKQLQNIRAVKSETKKDLFRKACKGKEYIDTYFTSQLSVEQISKEIGLSEYHFFRLFKSTYKTSPHQYIIQKRLKYAETLLKQGETSLTLIAHKLGFSDIHSFSKAFKKHFGKSPSHLSF